MKIKCVLLLCFMAVHAKKEEIDVVVKPTAKEVALQQCAGKEIDYLLFAPDQGKEYKTIIRGLIQLTAVPGSISMAAFRFTDKDIKDDLIAAHQRGVTVEAVFDPGAVSSGFYSQAFYLCEAGIRIYQYMPVGLLLMSQRTGELQRSSYPTIMHQKTMVFKNTVGGKDIVVFGSLNFTTAGFYGNEEAVQIRNKPELVQAFLDHFEMLKQRSFSVELHKGTSTLSLKPVAQGPQLPATRSAKKPTKSASAKRHKNPKVPELVTDACSAFAKTLAKYA